MPPLISPKNHMNEIKLLTPRYHCHLVAAYPKWGEGAVKGHMPKIQPNAYTVRTKVITHLHLAKGAHTARRLLVP